MTPRRQQSRAGVAAVALGLLAAGCGVARGPDLAPRVPLVQPSGVATASLAPAAGRALAEQTCADGTAQVATAPPLPVLPRPGAMPAGTWEAVIQHRGTLIAGVDQNTYGWAYRDAGTDTLRGFDIDMIDAVARAIFGPDGADHVRFRVVPNAGRIGAVANHSVDILAQTMTITCHRRTEVAFSAEYYHAEQDVLVPQGSPITSVASLAGRKACAVAESTSLQHLVDLLLEPPVVPVQVTNQTDCLVLLQQGQVDAISTDDAILRGLAAQDPTLHVLGLHLAPEPYGMAISRDHQDFVAFVNAVLASEAGPQGHWAQTYEHWLGHLGGAVMPTAVYDIRATR